jgi:CRP-like cAMP-binding protein
MALAVPNGALDVRARGCPNGDMSTHPLAAHFGALPVFRGLADDDLTDLLRALRPQSMTPGQTIFEEGAPGDALFVVDRGSVRITVSGLELARLEKGAVFGELALIDGAPRSATVVCAEHGALYRLDKTEFDYLRRNLRPAAFKVLRNLSLTLADRLRDTNDHIARALSGEPEPAVDAGAARGATADEPSLWSKLAFWRR